MGKRQSNNATVFDLLPKNTIIGLENIQWIESRIESVFRDEMSIQIDQKEVDFVKADLITNTEFAASIKSFKQIRFNRNVQELEDASIDFKTSAQPLYHKNFNLISESAHNYLDNGYTLYILSDSQKQQKVCFIYLKTERSYSI